MVRGMWVCVCVEDSGGGYRVPGGRSWSSGQLLLLAQVVSQGRVERRVWDSLSPSPQSQTSALSL